MYIEMPLYSAMVSVVIGEGTATPHEAEETCILATLQAARLCSSASSTRRARVLLSIIL